MTYHSQLNWIMLATILGLAFFLYLKPELEKETTAEFQISLRDPSTVKTIQVIRHGEHATIQRIDNQWYLKSPFYARADTGVIGNILNILSANSRQRFLMTDHEDFNLDHPIIELYLDDDYFAFGGLAPTTDQQYLAINQHVYLVSPRYAIWIPVKPIDVVSTGLLSEDEVPVRFDLQDISIQRSDSGNADWRLINGGADRLKADLLDRWVQLWRSSQASELILDEPRRLAAQPAGEITILGGRKISLFAWRDDNGILLFRDNEQIGYYYPAEIGQQLLNP